MISNQPLVRITLQLQICFKSKSSVEGLIRATVFDHFVAELTKRIAFRSG
jgi:hypothetical protein